MQEACSLSRWFGAEAVRIYAELSETTLQREQRKLREFIERRGGTVSVRELMQFHWPLRDQRDEAERQLGVLVKNGFGKWIDDKGSRGPAARKFQMFGASTSTSFGKIRGENEKPVDVDVGSSRKITPASPPDAEPAGVSVPLMITHQMEAELLRRGLTQCEINKLTPQQAHEILATPATPTSGSEQEIAADIVIGEDPEGETLI